MRVRPLAALLALGLATLIAPAAFADDCRVAAVPASADPAKNTGMGGHLAQHIYSTAKLPKDKLEKKAMSYDTKSVFQTEMDFLAAWKAYLQLDKKTTGEFNVKNCSKLEGEGQTVTVAMLTRSKQDTIKGYSCHDATCSKSKRDDIDFSKVAFWYRFVKPSQLDEKKNPDTGSWILVSAYPTN
jgi:hypothetical protein